MKNLFSKDLRELMYVFVIEWTLRAKFGKDIGGLIFSFIKEPPKPYRFTVINPEPCPWDWLQEPSDCIDLPLFAP